MKRRVAIVGAGVSGLTCGIVFAENGFNTTILAEQVGDRTDSAAAAAMWYPYDTGPADQTIAWALATYRTLRDLAHDPRTGVSIVELRTFSRIGEIEMPDWALLLGARPIRSGMPAAFVSGFALEVPVMDTSVYLNYLVQRFREAGGQVESGRHFSNLEEVDSSFDLIVNCTGLGARTLAQDAELEPHRGQVAVVAKIASSCAVVCDDAPLMYAIPRGNDCVFGGTNEVSEDRAVDPATTASILAECSRILEIDEPKVLRERVGLRPFRRSGVRLERAQLRDARSVIHNYGHGGSGFTLSWGCAQTVLELAR